MKPLLMIIMLPFGFFLANFCFDYIMKNSSVGMALLIFFVVVVAVPTLIVRPWKKNKKEIKNEG